jgi:hypothetical protein
MRNRIALILGISTLLSAGAFAQGEGRTFQPPASRPAAIEGSPYSGNTTLDSTQITKDGTPLSQRVVSRRVYRDGHGRIRTEEPLLLGPAATSPLLIVIQDSVAGVEYTLDTQTHVAHRSTYPPVAPQARSIPPPTTAPKYSALNENLGTQTIEGVLASGTRSTLSYPAGTWGYDRPVTTVHESWWSKDLGATVMSKNTLPAGELVSRLTNINRLEPDPILFLVPWDYTIMDENGPFTIKYARP